MRLYLDCDGVLADFDRHFMEMIVCMSRDKRNYCQPGDVLIDDRPHFQAKWEGAGGVWITHTSAAESITKLTEHLRLKAA